MYCTVLRSWAHILSYLFNATFSPETEPESTENGSAPQHCSGADMYIQQILSRHTVRNPLYTYIFYN